MKRFLRVMIVIFCGVVFSGCDRHARWYSDVFYQGECCDHMSIVVRDHMRSIRMYDQFSTRALFDILWISPEVQDAFIAARAYKHSLSDAERYSLREQQRCELAHVTDLYVFMPIACNAATSMSNWSFLMSIGNQSAGPYSITAVELGPEYRACIPEYCQRARSAYHIRFLLRHQPGHTITVTVSSTTCKASAQWKFDASGKLCVPVLKRHGTLAYDL